MISPLTLNFGNQMDNSTSPAQAISVTNLGTQTLVISNLTEAGADAAYFAFASGAIPGSSPCSAGASLAPGQSCVSNITFTPAAVRAYQAQINFVDHSGTQADAQQTVQLVGAGIARAHRQPFRRRRWLSEASPWAARAGAQTVTLMNAGSLPVSIASVAIAGTNAVDFEIAASGTTCPAGGGTLAIGANCALAVRLAPLTAGAKNANLIFTDNATNSPQSVALSGTATAAPVITVAPASVSFAAQSAGTVSAPQPVSVSNAGSVAAATGAVALSGTNAANFVLSNPCAPTLAAGATCQISVSFSPPSSASPGAESAALNVAAGTPQVVGLTGSVTQAAISVPSSFAFTPELAGTSGAAQPITVTNSSSGPFAGALAVSSVTKGGANPGDFDVTADSCIGASTAPATACKIQLAFAPVEGATCGANGGARSATLVINDNAPGSPHTVALSGTASDFCIDAAPGQGVSEPITAGQTATYSLEIASSMGFSGAVALACSGAPPLGTCAVTTTPATSPTTVQVTATTPGQFQLIVTTVGSSAASGRAWRKRTRGTVKGARAQSTRRVAGGDARSACDGLETGDENACGWCQPPHAQTCGRGAGLRPVPAAGAGNGCVRRRGQR